MKIAKQAAIVLVGLVLGGAMVMLGLWQLEVYRSQGAKAAVTRAAEAPVSLASVAIPGQQVIDGFGRTVEFSGRYAANQQLLVPIPEQPGRFRVLTALIQADGSAVPVVRGVVEGQNVPAPPMEQVSQRGILLPSEDDLDQPAGSGEIGSVRLGVLAQNWSQPLVAGFVTLSAADAEAQGMTPAVAALPEGQGRLRNGAYALQWWIFAAFAVGMSIKMAKDIGQAEDYREAESSVTPAEPERQNPA